MQVQRAAALIGVVAVAVALGVGELFAGLDGRAQFVGVRDGALTPG